MEGCIELVGSEPNTTYFMKDLMIIAKRIISTECRQIVERWYNRDGKKHRGGDLPAKIRYHKNGKTSSECWYKNGERHRDDLPAVIYYRENGQKSREYWYKNGNLHRTDGKPPFANYPKSQKPTGSILVPRSVEDRLTTLEAVIAKLSAQIEKQ